MTTVDTGKAQIDAILLSALTAEGVRDGDARELARMDAFGGSVAASWIAGMSAVARMMNRQPVSLDWGTLPRPWDTVGALLSSNGTDNAKTLASSLTSWSLEVQSALVNAVAAVAMMQAAMEATAAHLPMQTAPSPKQAAAIAATARYMRPVDQDLMRSVQRILVREKGAMSQRRKDAGQQVIEWMVTHGKYIRSPLGRTYYLYSKSRRLYALDSTAFASFLYLLTGANPSSVDFRYFLADCKTAGEEGEQLEVLRVAHWDETHGVLRISRFDGTVYRLDGMTIEAEANGDGPILFEDSMAWAPYVPDFGGNGDVLTWSLELPNWERAGEACQCIYSAWWKTSFFSELCPTRPILVLKGEKGSGKTMALRVMLRLMFGATTDVCGLPDKADSFIAMTSNAHIVVLDNMDTLSRELRDKFASLSTGKLDQLRELYTTNETRTIAYRCWLAITSRVPDTLQRDDLVDRTLILPVARIEDANRSRESLFLKEVATRRSTWWGDLLTALNTIVAELRSGDMPDRGGLRMEDWAALGTVIARAEGHEAVWASGLKTVREEQSAFLLEDNAIVQAITAWLGSPSFTPMPQTTRHLYEAARAALFGIDHPDESWPRSVKSFGRQLKGMQRELQTHFRAQGYEMTWRTLHGEQLYEFAKR